MLDKSALLCYHHFNSHAHVERDYGGFCSFGGDGISTHTLTWSVTFELNICVLCFYNFNSHAHVERDRCRSNFMARETHFNSHAHVERDRLSQLKKSGYYISTHTLTWSVTNFVIL